MVKKFLTISIVLFITTTHVLPLSAFEKKRKTLPVVAKFGGECEVPTFQPSRRLKQLIAKIRQRQPMPCDVSFCEGAFAFDLNGDGRSEYLVRLGCGATGNCTWGIFSDRRPRLLGTFTAWFFYIHKRTGAWNQLTAYTRQSGEHGAITTFANRKGKYIQTSENADRGEHGNYHPFLRRMGIPKCS